MFLNVPNTPIDDELYILSDKLPNSVLFKGHQEMDKAFNWGFSWKRGRK